MEHSAFLPTPSGTPLIDGQLVEHDGELYLAGNDGRRYEKADLRNAGVSICMPEGDEAKTRVQRLLDACERKGIPAKVERRRTGA